MYYLSRIAHAMSEVGEDQEHEIAAQHPRYQELCRGEKLLVHTHETSRIL